MSPTPLKVDVSLRTQLFGNKTQEMGTVGKFLDPEQNCNDDTRNVHHCPEQDSALEDLQAAN